MKKIVIISLMSVLLLTACEKKAVKPDEPVAQMTEQDSGQESSIEGQGKPGSMAAKQEEPVKGSSEPGSPETSPKPGVQEANTSQSLKEDNREAASKPSEPGSPEKEVQDTSKPSPSPKAAEGSTPKPAATIATPATPAVEPTPAPHTSCTWDGGSVTTAAGCSSEGVKTFTCTVCGNTRTESIAAAGHTYTTESKAATCTENGYTKTYCTACGNVQSESTQPATGHTLQEEWLDNQWYHAASCESDGTGHFNSCINCKYSEKLPWPALGHEPDAGTILYDSTYTTEGIIEHSCIRCGATLDDEIIPIKPHEHHWVMDEDGFTEYCDICYSGKE